MTGYFVDMNGVAHGFLLSTNGTVTVLDATGAGTASGEGTQTLDINSSGAIVGWITTGTAGGVAVNHSFIRAANGTYTIFDPVQAGPANGSLADRITDDGAIIGVFFGRKPRSARLSSQLGRNFRNSGRPQRRAATSFRHQPRYCSPRHQRERNHRRALI